MMAKGKSFSPQHTEFGVIGDAMILHERYDPEQLWFPFMKGVILQHAPDLYDWELRQKSYVKTGWRDSVRARRNRPPHLFAQHKQLYDYRDVDQRLLPFAEGKEILKAGELGEAKKAWERHENGKDLVLMITALKSTPTVVKSWANASLAGRFYADPSGHMFFELYADWLFAKLRWHRAEHEAA